MVRVVVVDSLEGRAAGRDAAVEAEASIVKLLLIARGALVLIGGVTALTAWRSYRRPRLMLATLGLSAVESSWLMRRWLRRGMFDDPFSAWIDTAASSAGLLALAAATTVEDRTTWTNWISPLAYTTSGVLGVGLDLGPGAAGVAVLGGTYLATVASSVGRGGSLASTAIANMLSYVGIFVGARSVISHFRRSANELQAARLAEIASAERIAAERERNRQHRLVHDSALQTLEAVAAGWGTGTDAVLRSRARDEGGRLRAALRDEDLEIGGLAAGLQALADRFRAEGLDVELDVGDLDGDPSVAGCTALCGAAAEAVRNVIRHAQTSRVVMRCVAGALDWVLTVRDFGVGFGVDTPTSRFGVSRSIVARMREVGGDARIESAPRQGTLVTLTFPRDNRR